MTPQEKSHSEFEKIQNYEKWAKNYDQQWIKRVVKLDLISSKSLQLMINELQEKIQNTLLSTSDISQKKILLEILAFLMLAPVNIRPDAKQLQNIMDTFDFIFDGKPENFVSQLLERKYSVNMMSSQPTNGYVSISDLNIKPPTFFKR